MTPQERDVLLPLLDKLKATTVPDKDAEADQLIRQALQVQPDGAYILAQTVLMQDYALHAAQDRIAALEKQLQPAAQPAPASSGGFLSGLFGSGGARPAQNSSGPWGPAPVSPYGPQIASAVQPQYQPPSFLRSAAQSAVGLAGGALLFQGLEGLFGGRGGFGGGFGGGGFLGANYAQPENVEIVNNNYDNLMPSNSGTDISDQDYFDNGGGGGDFGGGTDT